MTEATHPAKLLNFNTLTGWLQSRLSEERFQHSLGAHAKALELARRFKFSKREIEKAGLAGLLHDAAKLMGPKDLREACTFFEIALTEEDLHSMQTLHPFVGAEMVRVEFGIEDADVLNAIRYHTTGRPGMSPVEKVVYIADKVEENTRNPLYTQKINAVINNNDLATLDKTVLYILDSTITFLIEKGQVIHPRTITTRNDLVTRLRKTGSTTTSRPTP